MGDIKDQLPEAGRGMHSKQWTFHICKVDMEARRCDIDIIVGKEAAGADNVRFHSIDVNI